MDINVATFIDNPVSTFSDNVREFKGFELEKSTESFSTLIGKGGFGQVFKGIFHHLPIAVKLLKKVCIWLLSEIFMYMYGLAHLYRTIFQTVGWMWKDVSTERCSLSLGMSLFRASPLAVSLWTIYLVVRPSHYPVVTVKQSKNGQWEGLATRLLTMNTFPFSFQHPNLIQLMGYCSTPPALIFPFMERLSLYHCLHAYKVKNEFPFMISTICLFWTVFLSL